MARRSLTRVSLGLGFTVFFPPQCYTKTAGVHNPCWVCHVPGHGLNAMRDDRLQVEYSFSEFGTKNRWQNLFVDRSTAAAAISDATVLAYVRQDNYAALRESLLRAAGYPGYRPDLNLALGFDADGFARDGPGAFWPTNGSTGDVMIRLSAAFRSAGGAPSREVYKVNLALLEAAFGSDPGLPREKVRWPTEPLDETAVGADLDGDGRLTTSAQKLVGLPAHYFGAASAIELRRAIFPKDTEFFHTLRYLDPEAAGFLAKRLKELRYAKKVFEPEDDQILERYEEESDEKQRGRLPIYPGSADVGLRNEYGWMLQAFIEDEGGRLRLESDEEHRMCMGCHSSVGVTVDQTFSFARKLPGRDGWRHQDLRGMTDAPQRGQREPEILAYFRRVGAGDEFRANTELLERYFPNGKLNEAAVRAAVDLAELLLPSRERALALNKTYLVMVREQRFELGRDALLAPAQNVHAEITDVATGLEPAKRVYRDGQLRLDWSRSRPGTLALGREADHRRAEAPRAN